MAPQIRHFVQLLSEDARVTIASTAHATAEERLSQLTVDAVVNAWTRAFCANALMPVPVLTVVGVRCLLDREQPPRLLSVVDGVLAAPPSRVFLNLPLLSGSSKSYLQLGVTGATRPLCTPGPVLPDKRKELCDGFASLLRWLLANTAAIALQSMLGGLGSVCLTRDQLAELACRYLDCSCGKPHLADAPVAADQVVKEPTQLWVDADVAAATPDVQGTHYAESHVVVRATGGVSMKCIRRVVAAPAAPAAGGGGVDDAAPAGGGVVDAAAAAADDDTAMAAAETTVKFEHAVLNYTVRGTELPVAKR